MADAESSSTESNTTSIVRPRLWPAYVILLLQVVSLISSVTPSINMLERFQFMMLGPLSCLLLFLLWLGFASRLRWRERFAIIGGLVLLAAIAALLIDSSMAVAMWIYGIPLSMLAITLALHLARDWSAKPRIILTLTLVGVGWSVMLLGRLDGFTGNYLPEFAWRWSATEEQRLEPLSVPAAASGAAGGTIDGARDWNATQIEWPSFRGAERNSCATGMAYELNWKTSPPREIWRTAVGPAWSSFAYVSGRLFTQEQRGEDELISCYDASDGSLIWGHTEAARFTEVVSGAGPRHSDIPQRSCVRLWCERNSVRPRRCRWQTDLASRPHEGSRWRLPMWGFSSSPLVLEEVVIVHADGDGDNGLIAFDLVAGEPIWRVSSRGMNFSSAQPVELDGRPFALFADEAGLIAIDPTNGNVVWKFTPSGWKGPAIVQMQQIDATSLIVPLGDGIGTARLDVAYEDDQWKVTERWSSNRLKPTFNDFVYHDGFLYGFDRNIFTCVDAENGNRKWKRGRYGFGQVVLLADRSQLIVAAENGEAVLLDADPSGHSELGSVKVVSGKTWNHPIVADGNLFLRNGSETVCLELVR